MVTDHGFVDLRPSQMEGDTSGAFWPSFTDIMMVVMMIFMLSAIVLMVRNDELVSVLRATIATEREVVDEAETLRRERDQLAQQWRESEQQRQIAQGAITRLESEQQASAAEVATLRQQLMERELELARQGDQIVQITAQRQARDALLERTVERVTTLTTALTEATQQQQQQQQQYQRLDEQLSVARRQIALLEQQLAEQEQARLQRQDEYDQLLQAQLQRQDEYDQLLQAQLQRQDEYDQLLQQRQLDQVRMVQLRGEYAQLQQQYGKLLRPARSTEGKRVVEVQYDKGEQGEYRYRLRSAGETSWQVYAESQLHQRLAELKQQLGDALYVRIIIPEQSGLSYSEAWRFTQDLLAAYDYYYQNNPAR